jgi:hypothetical protein
MRKKKSQLKIYINTNEDANANIVDALCKSIAKTIYQSQEFQDYQKSILNAIQPAI